MILKKIIYSVDLRHKIIGVKSYKRIAYYVFPNNQFQLLKKYLYEGIIVEFAANESSVVNVNGQFATQIISVYKLYDSKGNIYYDKKKLNNELYNFLNGFENVMFLDLEMTMPPYSFRGKGFVTEIIQVGFLIVDKDGNELYKYSNYIKTTVNKQISDRTFKFLSVNPLVYETTAISYKQFYKDFNNILEKYDPKIIIYGKNDQLVLNDSYKINKVKDISKITKFVNINKLIKNFYELKNDPGLFKLYGIYYKEEEQIHNAYLDSYVTKKVFDAFKLDMKTNEHFYQIKKELN